MMAMEQQQQNKFTLYSHVLDKHENDSIKKL